MPNFLVPLPPTLTPTSESQAFSGSSFSLSSNSSHNYFGRHSHTSSGSAYLTDLTPPATPSHTNNAKGAGKAHNDVGPRAGSLKKGHEDRERRGFLSVDQPEDTGYDSDCEGEDAPLLNAVDAVLARLKKAKPTARTQRALKFIEENSNSPSEADNLLDEPLSTTPSMPAMKVVITEAEEDIGDKWTGDFNDKTKIEAEIATSTAEEVGATPTPTQEWSFLLDKGKAQHDSEVDFEAAFHDRTDEADFFPDEIKLHPASSFAFGTGGISGWREEPACILDDPIDEEGSLYYSMSPTMPEQPVLRPRDDLDWTCSPLSLGSPSLVYDTSVSISQLISPKTLDAVAMAASPQVYNNSYDDSNPLISPLIPISSLMFASRRAHPSPDDMIRRGQDLDLPTLMRLEIAAATAVAPRPRYLDDNSLVLGDTRPSGGVGVGLGFDIPTSELPGMSFASCSSLPSIYSQPSWNSNIAGPTTSTPPQQACDSFAMEGVDASDANSAKGSDAMDVSRTPARQALSDITEESMWTPSRVLALANVESSKQSPVVGLGLGSLLESTLQSSSSISKLRSPLNDHLPPSVSVDMMDVVDGLVGFSERMKGASVILEDDECVDAAGIEPHCVLSAVEQVVEQYSAVDLVEIEPPRVLSDAPQVIKHYSPGIENWRRLCAEVEPMSVPLDNIAQFSPSTGDEKAGPSATEVDLPSGLSKASSLNSDIYHQALVSMQGFPFPLQYSSGRDDIPAANEASHPLLSEDDPRSPVAPTCQIRRISRSFPTLSTLSDIAYVPVQKSQSPDFIIEEVLRNPVPVPVVAPASVVKCKCAHHHNDALPSERSSLKSSKSIEGVGMGLPSNLAGRPPRPHDVSATEGDDTSKMMSSAEECQNLAKLSRASPSSDSSTSSPTFMVSEDRGGSRFFFRIPKFAKRSLYAIEEVSSPLGSSSTSSSQTATSPGRLLSAAWCDITSRLLSPRKSNRSKFSVSPTSQTTIILPLAGASGDARSSAPALTQLSATITEVSSSSLSSPSPSLSPYPTKDISCLPVPPLLVSRQPRFDMFSRISAFSHSPSTPVNEGGMSPGVVEHLDAPRGLGIFRRKASPTTPSDNTKVKKGSRFKPALVRRFQLLF
ncbi:hypothetical protein BDN70DRAFT_879438 [Pholiota conissans]|uniref:Uncharacterized protein n=1 Tax=Pholiota conissans TaxID=109636 RepID=A0A9P5Z223_9AGAR|nr:hypothetical protein BDN70DRAFT_879438 [Pholiota conissans]